MFHWYNRIIRFTAFPLNLLGATTPRGPAPSHYGVFTITPRHAKIGRIPLDWWSACRRNLYVTTHNTHNRHVLAFGGIRTRNPRKQAAAGPRQRPRCNRDRLFSVNPYPTAFPYGNGMVLHFYQQQESSTTKTVHKVINKGLKAYV